MEYFIGRISDIEEWDINKIVPSTLLLETKVEDLYKEIVPRTLLSKTKVFDNLPVMRLRTNKDYDYSPQSKEIEIWLEYNKDTDIIFVDPKKSIRREIQLNNLFK